MIVADAAPLIYRSKTGNLEVLRKGLSWKSVLRVRVGGAGAAVLAVSADLAEVYSVRGVFEPAAPGTVLPLQPFRSIPTGQPTIPYN